MTASDLSQAFGRAATAKSSALSGLLPPRSTPRQEPEVPAQMPEPQLGGALRLEDPPLADLPVQAPPGRVEHPAARPRGAGRELRTAPAKQEQSQTHQLLVYVSPAVKAAAERHRKQQRVTNGELVLNALDATHDDLDDLLAVRQTTARPENSLFPARRTSPRASTPSGRKVAFSFRATAVEVSIIQELVREFGALSQSELIATALDRFLLGTARGRRG